MAHARTRAGIDRRPGNRGADWRSSSASMRAPRIPGKRCGTRLVALMCASLPDAYVHRLAGTAHTRPSSRLGSRTAVLRWHPQSMWERGPCSPPRGDTRRAAVAPPPMRSANRAPITDVSAHRPPTGGVLNAKEDSRVPGRPLPPRTRPSAWTRARRPQRTTHERVDLIDADARNRLAMQASRLECSHRRHLQVVQDGRLRLPPSRFRYRTHCRR